MRKGKGIRKHLSINVWSSLSTTIGIRFQTQRFQKLKSIFPCIRRNLAIGFITFISIRNIFLSFPHKTVSRLTSPGGGAWIKKSFAFGHREESLKKTNSRGNESVHVNQELKFQDRKKYFWFCHADVCPS